MRTDRGRRIVVMASLVLLGVQALQIGVWATFFPRSWFGSFPGLGRHWAAGDGPYNHHLVTDVGALFLGLAVLTVAALWFKNQVLVRTAGAAWVISALPHCIYHLTHRAGLATGDYAASVGGLATWVVLGVVCVALPPKDPSLAGTPLK